VPPPQLVVLLGEGRDGFLPAQVNEHEGRPEGHELVARLSRTDREVAQHEDGHRVGRQVRKPQDSAQDPVGVAPPHSREEEEEDLQGKAEEDHEVDLPCVPQLLGDRHQAETERDRASSSSPRNN